MGARQVAGPLRDWDLEDLPVGIHPDALRDDPRLRRIAKHVRGIMAALELDLEDPNLVGTDERVARMYLELFAGLQEGAEPSVTTFPNDQGYNQMVVVKDIRFYSMCAHHFLPFFGRAHVGYVPNGQVVGLSKLARIVEFYARRPQIQERMTEQVIQFLEKKLSPLGSIVVVEATHLCMEMRGIEKPGATTTTSAIRGAFLDRPARAEFFELIRRSPD
ncbi:MAG TPA: GTP cyclohydrolase I FolE [Chloroflexota bacterium]